MTKKKRITISLSDDEMKMLKSLFEKYHDKTFSETIGKCILFRVLMDSPEFRLIWKDFRKNGNKKRE